LDAGLEMGTLRAGAGTGRLVVSQKMVGSGLGLGWSTGTLRGVTAGGSDAIKGYSLGDVTNGGDWGSVISVTMSGARG
jgi:hypothetical protein